MTVGVLYGLDANADTKTKQKEYLKLLRGEMAKGINFKAPPGVEGKAYAGKLFNAVKLDEYNAREVFAKTDSTTVI